MSVVKADWEEAQVKQSKLDDKEDEDLLYCWRIVQENHFQTDFLCCGTI